MDELETEIILEERKYLIYACELVSLCLSLSRCFTDCLSVSSLSLSAPSLHSLCVIFQSLYSYSPPPTSRSAYLYLTQSISPNMFFYLSLISERIPKMFTLYFSRMGARTVHEFCPPTSRFPRQKSRRTLTRTRPSVCSRLCRTDSTSFFSFSPVPRYNEAQ